MDPLTAALNCVTGIVALAGKVWDAMPADVKTTDAKDWGTFTHNLGSLVTGLQDKINAAIGVGQQSASSTQAK